MPTKLKGLVVDRVDLVDVGANLDKRTGDGAHIMLYKRAGDQPRSIMWRVVDLAKAKGASSDLIAKSECAARSFDEILAGQQARQALDSLWNLYYAFMEAAQSIFQSDEADKIGLLKDSAIDFMNAFLTALPEAVDEAGVEKVGRKISAARMKQLQDMHAKLGSLLKEVSEGDQPMAKTAEEIAADNAAANADVQKRIDESIAKALEASNAAHAVELKKRDDEIAKANEATKIERDLRVLKQFEDQAASEFVGLSLQLEKKADAKTDAEIFKALSEKAPEEWPRVEAILKAAATAIREGALFVEQGTGAGAEGGDAQAQIMALADALVKSGSEKTREQAVAKIAAAPEHRELYTRYVEETRNRVH